MVLKPAALFVIYSAYVQTAAALPGFDSVLATFLCKNSSFATFLNHLSYIIFL